MNTNSIGPRALLLLLFFICDSCVLRAADEPAPQPQGPHGGKMIAAGSLRLEVTLSKDRRVHIYTYGDDRKPAPPGDLVVKVQAMSRPGAVDLRMEKTELGFVAHEVLPPTDRDEVVVEVREHPGARPVVTPVVLRAGDDAQSAPPSPPDGYKRR